MFGPAGMTYVYLIYGMYHCLNVVTDVDGCPSAVLIRALQLDRLPDWVDGSKERHLHRVAAGPGKLCRALNIDLSCTAQPLEPGQALWLEHRAQHHQGHGQPEIVQTTRIGLSQGTDLPWRWYVRNCPAVSKL